MLKNTSKVNLMVLLLTVGMVNASDKVNAGDEKTALQLAYESSRQPSKVSNRGKHKAALAKFLLEKAQEENKAAQAVVEKVLEEEEFARKADQDLAFYARIQQQANGKTQEEATDADLAFYAKLKKQATKPAWSSLLTNNRVIKFISNFGMVNASKGEIKKTSLHNIPKKPFGEYDFLAIEEENAAIAQERNRSK